MTPPGATGQALQHGLIAGRLRTTLVGMPLEVRGCVPSTNAALQRLARDGAPAGTVLLADEQTAARGRRGQPWFSPPGVNVYLSVLLRPDAPPRGLPLLAFVGSLAVADAVRAEGLTPAVKWPNDVLVGGRKVAGVLSEAATTAGRTDWVILGVGVNLNVPAEALRAALGDAGRAASSLGVAAGREIDRNAFAATLIEALDRRVRTWVDGGPEAVVAAWRDLDILTGRRVEVRGDGAAFEGRVLGLDAEGHLLVRESLTAPPRRVVDGEVRRLE
jgi:BirA family biotin operon repressor/biotin-[acetyl-CoA-carboxylase] ligase